MARLGKAWHGSAWHGMAVEAGQGMAWHDGAGHGSKHTQKGDIHMDIETITEEKVEEIQDTDVVEALKCIAKDDADGLIQPEEVVKVAADEESPLHRFFEWDDTEAAHQYRLFQARKLITRVNVLVVDSGPAMVNVKIATADGTRRQGYVPTERALADPDLRAQVMAEARHMMIHFRNKLRGFEQTQRVIAALDRTIEAIDQTTGEVTDG